TSVMTVRNAWLRANAAMSAASAVHIGTGDRSVGAGIGFRVRLEGSYDNGRMIWIVLATVLVLVLVAIVVANVKTPEKRIEHRIAHRHALADPQFRREMGVMLGPSIVPGNRIDDLQNGR